MSLHMDTGVATKPGQVLPDDGGRDPRLFVLRGRFPAARGEIRLGPVSAKARPIGSAAVTDVFARRATLARSLRLLSEFRYEQADPARFYGALASDTASMVADLWLAGH